MAFVKYEAPAKAKAAPPSVRVGKLGISIDQDKFDSLIGTGVEYVDLYFDADTNAVGIAKSTKSPSSFKVTKRGRNTASYFVAAGKFYAAFSIPVVGTITSELEKIQDYAAFLLGGKPKADAPREKRTYRARKGQ